MGIGVAKDIDRGDGLQIKAGRLGDSRGQNVVGTCYFNGKNGFEKDYKISVYWFDLGAQQGDKYAQANLAWAYLKGLGTEKSIDKALHWYRLSAGYSKKNTFYNK